MLFINQVERRASGTVFFTSENNDIANQSVDTSFFTSEKNHMTNQLASLARRDYFYLDAFWRVNLGTYIIRYSMECSRSYENENRTKMNLIRRPYLAQYFLKLNRQRMR